MDALFEYLTSLSGSASYLIIFAILVACGLGLPLPEDIPLIASGYLAWQGTMNIPMAFVVTMAGVAVGDSALFFIGRKVGDTLLEHPGVQTLFPPKKVRRTRAYFRKYGPKLVFFARFVAGFRAVAFFTAGAMKMNYIRFILLDMLAALLSVPIWIAIGWALGHYLGNEIEAILVRIQNLKGGVHIVIGAIVLIVIAKIFIQYRKSKKSERKKVKAA